MIRPLLALDRLSFLEGEGKVNADALDARYAFQAKRYAWNKGITLALLSNFEETRVFVVGSKPRPDEADIGLFRTWNYQQYPLIVQEIYTQIRNVPDV
jgi:hypothetical protein